MAIPTEFASFANEEGLIQRFLIPLLHRLGFSIVVNYHGKREFGKDLVFGEIDRFNHVRYHGMQAKYEASIGKAAMHGLIQDCEEAYAHDFAHPQTGQEHKISSFYAVNAGSVSDEARDLFFDCLRPGYADNVRLMTGKDLLALDRSAVISRVESGRELLAGILAEMNYDQRILQHVIPELQTIAQGDGQTVHYPPLRLRLNAIEIYLVKPLFVSDLPLDVIERLWAMGTAFNRTLDGVSQSPLHTVVSIRIPAAEVLQLAPLLNDNIRILAESLRKALAKLGPLASF